LARRCARSSTPFVLGPLNGGVPWPNGFDTTRRHEREWLSYFRGAYKLLPGHSSMLARTAAIIVGSQSTLREIPDRFKNKCIYMPENAVDPDRFSLPASNGSSKVMRACFVGRLVPYKGPDMLLEAVAPLVRDGRLQLDIIGDGPMMQELRSLIQERQLQSGVTMHGWIAHAKLEPVMRKSRLFLFPSIREFGGGVVLEAMALGLVPVVVNYAGPGELVTEAVGYKLPLGTRSFIVERLRSTVTAICNEPAQLDGKSEAARDRVRKLFTWDVKAGQIIEIYDWVRGRRTEKPKFFELEASATKL